MGISVEGREGESSSVTCLNCDFVFHQTVNGVKKAALAKNSVQIDSKAGEKRKNARCCT